MVEVAPVLTRLPRSAPPKALNSLNKPFNDRKKFLFNMYEEQLASPVYLVFQNHNLTVNEVKKVRQSLKEKCHPLAQIGIVRTALLKAVIRDTEFVNMGPLFTGPVAIMYLDYARLAVPHADLPAEGVDPAEIDTAAVLRSMIEVAGQQSKLLLIGGKFDRQLLNPQLVKHLATLPSFAQLHAQLAAGVFGPIQSLHQTVNHIPQSLVFALNEVSKEAEVPTATEKTEEPKSE
ncbi:hypothetical protein IWQ60_010249 [Tieghemiomyces parasiticus]|uniref:50S ribosomal protein L10 n=1 Tax=Tieghemiomyces parasiticus TaxID=78921 RepID=A0A9W7ZTI7_9FUNG|nr:hypothetical protein IWQ60_010249 [Tieghemiomyces parasiticus]